LQRSQQNTDPPAGKSPSFLVAALKDPIGANLDRIQIIKGWLDAKNETHEKIYEVVWSGDRKPDPKTGKLPSVGDTVDVPNATYTNTIGASELIKVWKDPEFDPAQRAFYYVRVLENSNPTMDGIRCQVFRHQDASRGPHEAAGARLHLAHMVHARKMK